MALRNDYRTFGCCFLKANAHGLMNFHFNSELREPKSSMFEFLENQVDNCHKQPKS